MKHAVLQHNDLTFSTESSSSVALLYRCMSVHALLFSASTIDLLMLSSNWPTASSSGAAEAGLGIGMLKFPPPTSVASFESENHSQHNHDSCKSSLINTCLFLCMEPYAAMVQRHNAWVVWEKVQVIETRACLCSVACHHCIRYCTHHRATTWSHPWTCTQR